VKVQRKRLTGNVSVVRMKMLARTLQPGTKEAWLFRTHQKRDYEDKG